MIRRAYVLWIRLFMPFDSDGVFHREWYDNQKWRTGYLVRSVITTALLYLLFVKLTGVEGFATLLVWTIVLLVWTIVLLAPGIGVGLALDAWVEHTDDRNDKNP